MFRRATTPPPNTSHQESNKPFNDWKRRVQQKTRIKLGLATDLKDSVTGNIDSRIEHFRSHSTKLTTTKIEIEQFCNKIRNFLSLENNMMSFSPESTIFKLYEEVKNNRLSIVVDYILTYEIETPINILHHKAEEIEQLVNHRNNALLDYQHHVRKLEGLQEKSPNKCEDIKARQTKVEAASERLKESNQFLEANFRAFEYTFVRFRKRLGNIIYAINFFISQTMANSLLVASNVTPEINIILEQMNTLQISQQERRVVSVNASHDAAQILNQPHSSSSSSSSTSPAAATVHSPMAHQPSPSSSLIPKYIRSTSSLLSRGTESSWNEHQSLSGHHSIDRADTLHPFEDNEHHHSHHHHNHHHSSSSQNSNGIDSQKYELDDFVYSLNLHMGVLGEIFGRSLEDLPVQFTTQLSLTHLPSPTIVNIPSIILDCLIYLVHNSLQVEGIFRISGDEDTITDLRRSYDEGESHHEFRTTTTAAASSTASSSTLNQDHHQQQQSYNLSSLIKLYFRILPETLFPKKLYPILTAAAQQQHDTTQYINKMKEVFTLLTAAAETETTTTTTTTNSTPITNLNILVISYLFYLFHLITNPSNSAINKMTKDNISIVFAPTLLCSEGNSELNIFELQNGIQIIKKLIEHSQEIFGEIWEKYPLEKFEI